MRLIRGAPSPTVLLRTQPAASGRFAKPSRRQSALSSGWVPHVLHHIGLVAGAAVVTGIGGSVVLYLLGLVFSIPLLRRLWRRFHSWRALAAAVTVFTVLFLVSALVIGPAISGESAPEPPPGPEPSATHSEHHEGS